MTRPLVWMACLVMLMASLAPSVSHLLAAARGVPPMLAEICGVGGGRLARFDASPPVATAGTAHATLVDVALMAGRDTHPAPPNDADPSTDPDRHAAFSLEHCPFCATQAQLPALLPPSAFRAPVVTTTTASLPRLFYHSPRPLYAWASAQPRAPPPLS